MQKIRFIEGRTIRRHAPDDDFRLPAAVYVRRKKMMRGASPAHHEIDECDPDYSVP
jgi:hypothetical protein